MTFIGCSSYIIYIIHGQKRIEAEKDREGVGWKKEFVHAKVLFFFGLLGMIVIFLGYYFIFSGCILVTGYLLYRILKLEVSDLLLCFEF